MAETLDAEWRRLQAAYASLGEDELLRLAAGRDGLTDVARGVLDAEMHSRGLTLAVADADAGSEAVVLSSPADDPSQVMLWYFPVVAEAWIAAELLRTVGIEVRVEPAWMKVGEEPVLSEELEREKRSRYADKGLNRERLSLPGVNLFIDRERQGEAVKLLRQKMGLFPEREHTVAGPESDDEEDALFPVGEFESAEDLSVTRAALTAAGIWFRVEGEVVEVRFEDLERAGDVIAEAVA